MKSINLTNSEDLKKVQNELNAIFESRIANAELNEVIGNIDNLSFGSLKNIFESISDKLYESEKGKKIIKNYVKTITENKDLRNFYIINESICCPNNIKDSSLFLSEALSIVNSINKKHLEEGIKNIKKILKNAIYESKISKEELVETISKQKEINESIDYILKHKKSASNISEYVNHMSALNEHIKANNIEFAITENIDSPKKIMEDLNNALRDENLELWESKALNDMCIYTLSGKDKKELFESYKANCISTIDSIINESNVENKSRFSVMKEQLLNKSYNEENIEEDIFNLSKLYYTLSE